MGNKKGFPRNRTGRNKRRGVPVSTLIWNTPHFGGGGGEAPHFGGCGEKRRTKAASAAMRRVLAASAARSAAPKRLRREAPHLRRRRCAALERRLRREAPHFGGGGEHAAFDCCCCCLNAVFPMCVGTFIPMVARIIAGIARSTGQSGPDQLICSLDSLLFNNCFIFCLGFDLGLK